MVASVTFLNRSTGEGAGHRGVALGGGPGDGLGVVVVGTQVGGRIQRVEAEALHVRDVRHVELDPVLAAHRRRPGVDRGGRIRRVGVAADGGQALVVGEQHRKEAPTRPCSCRRWTGRRPGLGGDLAGVLGLHRDVADPCRRRFLSSPLRRWRPSSRCRCRPRPGAGHRDFAAAGPETASALMVFTKAASRFCKRRRQDVDVLGLDDGGAGTDGRLGLVERRRHGYRRRHAHVVGLTASPVAVVGRSWCPSSP